MQRLRDHRVLSPEWDIYIIFLLPETWGDHGKRGRKIRELETVTASTALQK